MRGCTENGLFRPQPGRCDGFGERASTIPRGGVRGREARVSGAVFWTSHSEPPAPRRYSGRPHGRVLLDPRGGHILIVGVQRHLRGWCQKKRASRDILATLHETLDHPLRRGFGVHLPPARPGRLGTSSITSVALRCVGCTDPSQIPCQSCTAKRPFLAWLQAA